MLLDIPSTPQITVSTFFIFPSFMSTDSNSITFKVKSFTSTVKNVKIPAHHDLKPRHPIYTEDLHFLKHTLGLEKRLLLWSEVDEYLCCPSLELKMQFPIAVMLKSDGNCKKMGSLQHQHLTDDINHRKILNTLFPDESK